MVMWTMYAIRKVAAMPKRITTMRIRWSFLGVGSEEVALGLAVEDVVVGNGDMVKG
jgi:hypothetical protein